MSANNKREIEGANFSPAFMRAHSNSKEIERETDRDCTQTLLDDTLSHKSRKSFFLVVVVVVVQRSRRSGMSALFA